MKKGLFEIAEEYDKRNGDETPVETFITDYVTTPKVTLNIGDKFVSCTPIGEGDYLVRVINMGGVPYSLIYSKWSLDRGLTEDASAPTTDEKGLVRWWLEEGRKIAYDAR